MLSRKMTQLELLTKINRFFSKQTALEATTKLESLMAYPISYIFPCSSFSRTTEYIQ